MPSIAVAPLADASGRTKVLHCKLPASLVEQLTTASRSQGAAPSMTLTLGANGGELLVNGVTHAVSVGQEKEATLSCFAEHGGKQPCDAWAPLGSIAQRLHVQPPKPGVELQQSRAPLAAAAAPPGRLPEALLKRPAASPGAAAAAAADGAPAAGKAAALGMRLKKKKKKKSSAEASVDAGRAVEDEYQRLAQEERRAPAHIDSREAFVAAVQQFAHTYAAQQRLQLPLQENATFFSELREQIEQHRADQGSRETLFLKMQREYASVAASIYRKRRSNEQALDELAQLKCSIAAFANSQ